MMSILPSHGRRLTGVAVALSGALALPLALPAGAQVVASNRTEPPTMAATEQAQQPQAVLLRDLLSTLEASYHVMVLYDSDLVGDKRVLAPAAGSLEEKLTAALQQANLKYHRVRDNYYLVVAATDAPVPGATPTSAAAVLDQTVSGRVTQANGDPLPGVTVRVKNGTAGTVTDADGRYTLTVPDGATLVFSYIGFLNQEVAVTGGSADVTLQSDTKTLSEVVVVGYGTQTRQELTTSVSSVQARSIERQTVAGFDQALQGQTPGVQVTAPTGAPGAGINLRIRGASTVNLNASPLYVIDGVPVLPTYDREVSIGNQKPNPLNAINPADIESIDVLKDGAAAAIYGVRASNGVVVITTKHGKAGKAQVTYNMYVGQQKLRKKIDLLNSNQFARLFNEMQVNNGTTIDPNDPKTGFANPDNQPYNTDWQDEMYRTAAIQNYQLGVSGGTDKTRYYASGGYFKQDGIIRNSGFDRYSFKLNLDQQVGSKFRLGTNLNLSRTYNNSSVRSELRLANSGTVLGALSQIPNIPVRNPDGRYALNPLNLSDNPIGNLLETSNTSEIYQVIGNAFGELNILPNLTARSSIGIDFRSQLENQFLTRDYPGTLNSSSADRGSANTGNTLQRIWLWENTVTWNPTLGERSNLNLLVGQSMQASDRFTSNAYVYGFPSNSVPYLLAGTKFTRPNSYREQWGLMSYFGRATYDYDGRYLASLSLRADGSSRFGSNNKYGYFPAVGLGWRIGKESFFPQGALVSDLKVRYSFGANGNQEIPIYGRYSTYGVGYNYQGASGIVGGIGPDGVGNNDLKWETTYQNNVGLDVGLVKDRLTLTLDAYNKRTKDLLLSVPLPASSGSQGLTVVQNIGEVQNRGFEVGLNTTNVLAEEDGFGWTTSLNLTFNRNKVLDLGTVRDAEGKEVDRQIIGDYSIVTKGEALGSFYGWVTDGIFQSEAEVAAAAKQDNAKPGDIRFKDLNADGKIDDKDRTIIGNPNPKAIAGVTNTFTYKGLELSVFFQGSFGNDIYNENRTIIEGMADPVNQSTAVLNHWTPQNTNTDIPRAVRNDPNNNRRISNRWIEDGSYVRLKNLTVAYNFPVTVVKHIGMQGLRLYATGQNLITWTDYSGYDPEVSADPFSTTGFGRDLGVYPQARIYTIGLNATF